MVESVRDSGCSHLVVAKLYYCTSYWDGLKARLSSKSLQSRSMTSVRGREAGAYSPSSLEPLRPSSIYRLFSKLYATTLLNARILWGTC